MSDDKEKNPPPDDSEERTVFVPGGAGGATAPPRPEAEAQPTELPAEPMTPAAAEPAAEKTVPPAAEPPAEPPAEPAAEAPAETVPPTAIRPREHAQAIKVGDVLNHIFEVKRFIARGGMGEVFEGCNVNSDERVAIKVMLPALAADEKVVAMFRKEARTLTKLQHEALVNYRVLAQEPQLGVLYIVTEFIEGVELSEMLGKVDHSLDELTGLLQRLASGLSAAHRLGAIHRDMSPDNVLLPAGDVHQAKIIDFGIAKDLDASAATIVGDGFAGKLNYVAPEQLGDFGREVGPWTDVYSLGLVILAVAQGKNVNMSGSLVDAIDKRRKGPDLSPIPAELRPVIEAMLRPDPKERLRSMDDVLAMLGGARAAPPITDPRAPAAELVPPRRGPSKALLVGGVVGVALAAGAAGWYFMGDEIAPPRDPAATARSTINSVLPQVGCTWLDIGSVQNAQGSVSVAMRGVAGDATAAQRDLSAALAGAGVDNARLDFGDVAPITPAGCAALDTYRQARATASHLSSEQPRFEMMTQPAGAYAGEEAATAVIDFNFANHDGDFAILGIEPSGVITTLIPSRAAFESELARSVNGRPITELGDDRYRLNIDLDHQGWSGIILVTGRGPFEADLVAPPVGSRGPSWQQPFLSAAAERQWRVEMVWFESVNRQAGDSAPPPSGDKT